MSGWVGGGHGAERQEGMGGVAAFIGGGRGNLGSGARLSIGRQLFRVANPGPDPFVRHPSPPQRPPTSSASRRSRPVMTSGPILAMMACCRPYSSSNMVRMVA